MKSTMITKVNDEERRLEKRTSGRGKADGGRGTSSRDGSTSPAQRALVAGCVLLENYG